MAITKIGINKNQDTLFTAMQMLVPKFFASVTRTGSSGSYVISCADSDGNVLLTLTQNSTNKDKIKVAISGSTTYEASAQYIFNLFITESGAWLDVDTSTYGTGENRSIAAVIGLTNSGKTGIVLQTGITTDTSNHYGSVTVYPAAWGAAELPSKTYGNILYNKNQCFMRGVALFPPSCEVMYFPDIEVTDMSQFAYSQTQAPYEVQIGGVSYVTNGYLFLKAPETAGGTS